MNLLNYLRQLMSEKKTKPNYIEMEEINGVWVMKEILR